MAGPCAAGAWRQPTAISAASLTSWEACTHIVQSRIRHERPRPLLQMRTPAPTCCVPRLNKPERSRKAGPVRLSWRECAVRPEGKVLAWAIAPGVACRPRDSMYAGAHIRGASVVPTEALLESIDDPTRPWGCAAIASLQLIGVGEVSATSCGGHSPSATWPPMTPSRAPGCGGIPAGYRVGIASPCSVVLASPDAPRHALPVRYGRRSNTETFSGSSLAYVTRFTSGARAADRRCALAGALQPPTGPSAIVASGLCRYPLGIGWRTS